MVLVDEKGGKWNFWSRKKRKHDEYSENSLSSGSRTPSVTVTPSGTPSGECDAIWYPIWWVWRHLVPNLVSMTPSGTPSGEYDAIWYPIWWVWRHLVPHLVSMTPSGEYDPICCPIWWVWCYLVIFIHECYLLSVIALHTWGQYSVPLKSLK